MKSETISRFVLVLEIVAIILLHSMKGGNSSQQTVAGHKLYPPSTFSSTPAVVLTTMK